MTCYLTVLIPDWRKYSKDKIMQYLNELKQIDMAKFKKDFKNYLEAERDNFPFDIIQDEQNSNIYKITIGPKQIKININEIFKKMKDILNKIISDGMYIYKNHGIYNLDVVEWIAVKYLENIKYIVSKQAE